MTSRRARLVVALAVAAAALIGGTGTASARTRPTAATFALRELGRDELRPQPYMSSPMAPEAVFGPKFELIYGGSVGFWCDEFAAAMLRKAGKAVTTVQHDPAELARQFPLATPPYQPGDLVFVTYGHGDPYDHVGVLARARGGHLWDVEGNWPTGRYTRDGHPVRGVVLNERNVGDGAVSEVRRP